MRIAIIEDDEITRLELSKLLNTQGYETVLLTDFGNLTDELKQYSIELVLLDINLPYENGYEVCRKIKQVMPVPIIFVKSRDTNADELKSIQVDVYKRQTCYHSSRKWRYGRRCYAEFGKSGFTAQLFRYGKLNQAGV